MKVVSKGRGFDRFVGKRFACTRNGNTYEIEADDERQLAIQERKVGEGRDDTTADSFLCPGCGAVVYLSDDDNKLHHR